MICTGKKDFRYVDKALTLLLSFVQICKSNFLLLKNDKNRSRLSKMALELQKSKESTCITITIEHRSGNENADALIKISFSKKLFR